MSARIETNDYENTREGLRRICGAYRLVGDNWQEFRGGIRSYRIGEIELADIRLSPCRVVRDHHDEDYLGDHCYLVLQVEGSACMRQLNSAALLRPGDCTLIDSRYSSVFEYPSEISSRREFRQFSFHLGAHLLEQRLGKRRIPVAQVISGEHGAGRVLADTLISMSTNATALRDAPLREAVMELLSAAIGAQENCQATDAQRCAVSEADIRSHIAANIQHQNLSPQTVAEHFQISPRQLYRLMSSSGYTPAALIWRTRLEHARALLMRKDRRVSIIEVALSSGFKDPAHFSRAYSKAFGRSPKTARRAPFRRSRQGAPVLD